MFELILGIIGFAVYIALTIYIKRKMKLPIDRKQRQLALIALIVATQTSIILIVTGLFLFLINPPKGIDSLLIGAGQLIFGLSFYPAIRNGEKKP